MDLGLNHQVAMAAFQRWKNQYGASLGFLGASWSLLVFPGASWVWGLLGLLGASWVLGDSWGFLGLFWNLLGASWSLLGSLRCLWGLLGFLCEPLEFIGVSGGLLAPPGVFLGFLGFLVFFVGFLGFSGASSGFLKLLGVSWGLLGCLLEFPGTSWGFLVPHGAF